jgi:hypothetical protein
MRAHRFIALLAAASLSVLFAAPAPASNGGMEQRIRVQDRCDPETFNAAVGPGTCTGDGNVTFDRFVDELADGGHNGWSFAPGDTHINRGGMLHLVSQGGEVHTFTEVADFGPGCVGFLNDALGLSGPPAMNCGTAFNDPLLPGAEEMVSGLSVGTHKFECAIHPWMQTTVEVRDR